MTVSAHDIAAALRERQPGLPAVKLHKLLYYCQGHHLAGQGEPLFTETVCAWDMGPVVTTLWGHEKNHGPLGSQTRLGEAELNTIGYVLSRYGGMTGKDLATLSHLETPWLRANANRRPGGSVPIPDEWLREYFSGDGAPEAGDDQIALDSREVDALLAGAAERRLEPASWDDPAEIRRRLAARG